MSLLGSATLDRLTRSPASVEVASSYTTWASVSPYPLDGSPRPLPSLCIDPWVRLCCTAVDCACWLLQRGPQTTLRPPTRALRPASPVYLATSQCPTGCTPHPRRLRPRRRHLTSTRCYCCFHGVLEMRIVSGVAFQLVSHASKNESLVSVRQRIRKNKQAPPPPVRCIFAIFSSRFLIHASRSRSCFTL